MVYAFPTNETLWQQYAVVRAECLKAERGIVDATEFYAAHRAEMDEGAMIAWPERYDHDELSAIQHAMNLKLQDQNAFFAEYQNEPLPETLLGAGQMSAEEIAAKVNGLPASVVPLGCTHLTMFIDVQGTLLYYVIAAWADDFTGGVIEYGAYPDQRRSYFTLREANPTLAMAAPGAGLEGTVYDGLQKLTDEKLSKEWKCESGAPLRIERCLIDANWGVSTDTVYQFCRQTKFASLVTPSHGRYVGASSLPFSEYTKGPGDRVGHNWRIPSTIGKRALRHVLFDTNYWKSFIFARLGTAMGDKGSLALYGTETTDHRMFADQLTAEYPVTTTGRGRTVEEWKARPNHPDNHFLDGIVGCAVGASMQGVALPSQQPPQRKRVSLAELAARRPQARDYLR
jgi:phage terminase large subunit GpA-like protein